MVLGLPLLVNSPGCTISEGEDDVDQPAQHVRVDANAINALMPGETLVESHVVEKQQPPPVCDEFEPSPPTGHKYFVCYSSFDWENAQNTCKKMFKGDLVTINDATENDFVHSVALLSGADALWIGINDTKTEGTFVWASKEPVSYTNWEPGEPNDHLGNEDCGQIYRSTGTWNDLSCTDQLFFICETSKL
jgi:hypothetical protein